MEKAERNRFVAALRSIAELYGFHLTGAATELWWTVMQPYSFDDVAKAMQLHVTDGDGGRFMPKPANLLAFLRKNDGWLGPEEAWALVAPTLGDESVTVVWTQEIAEAFGIARSVADSPVQARLAFIEAYNPKLIQARGERRMPVWTVSLGFNPDARLAPVEEAVRLGRLTEQHARKLVPSLPEPAPAALDNVRKITDQMMKRGSADD